MSPTRRSVLLAKALFCAQGVLPLAALLRPNGAGAQVTSALSTSNPLPRPVPLGANDARALLLRARSGVSALPPRSRQALERTLNRLDEHDLDVSAGRTLVVNIAGAELIAYDSGQEVMRSRVIVGALRTRTPLMSTTVTGVRANPPWYVPTSIEPEIRAAGAVGFQRINGRYVQPPGPRNPLGPIRIGLYDSDGIFLHGTANPELFARADRALSHGCIRVERIIDVAAWLMDTTPAAIRATVAAGRTVEMLPAQEARVVLTYLTAWPVRTGQVAYHADPYGLDGPGARQAAFRRIQRPVPVLPDEPEAVAVTAPAPDSPDDLPP